MKPIEVNGIEILNNRERKIANNLFNEYYPKIKRKIKNTVSLKIYIREHEKEGRRRKFSVNIDAICPGKIFRAKAFDWDFARAIHKALNKIINEAEHKLHASEQHKMTKLIFLGTKGEIEEHSKKHKYHSSLLIEYKKFKLLVDYGTLQKYKLEKIKPNAIIITHAHPDHYIWTKENVETKVPVYLTKKAFDYGKFKPKNYKIIKANKKIKLGPFTIIPHNALHSIKCPNVSFEIHTGKKKIIYTGDVVDIKNKNKVLKKTDYYIGDGSSIRANLVRKKGNKIFGHARITTQMNWCKKAGIKNIIFTHFGKESIREEKEFLKKNPGIIFAYDGYHFQI